MDDVDKYLSELDELAGKKKGRVLRETYRGIREGHYREKEVGFYDKVANMERNIANYSEEQIRAYARRLMEIGIAEPSITDAKRGAGLYEKIGKGYKAIPRLLKAAKANKDVLSQDDYSQIKSFIQRNVGKRKQKSEGGLEGRVGVFILVTIAGIVLSVSSLTTTGNAISNLTATASGLLGIIFFIVGLVGLTLNLKKK